MTITVDQIESRIELRLQATNDDSQAQYRRVSDPFTEDYTTDAGVRRFTKILEALDQSLADTANEDLDLYDLGTLDIGNGPGRDTLGLAHTNSKIYRLVVRNQSISTGSLVFDTSQTGGWTSWMPSGTHSLEPGAMLCGSWPNGIDVADTSNHILRLTASSGAVVYDLQILSS